MFYTVEELSNLNRKELQKLCKQFKIKANKKNCELVEDLHLYFITLQNDEKALENQLKTNENEWLSEESDIETSNHNATYSLDKNTSTNQQKHEEKNDEQIKMELLKEVEARAAEKLSKIPRYNTSSQKKSEEISSPAVKKLKRQHDSKFNKMDSIDVYLAKKKRRADLNLNANKQTKVPKFVYKRIDSEVSFNLPPANRQITFTKRSSPRLSASVTSVLKERKSNATSVLKERKSNATSVLKERKSSNIMTTQRKSNVGFPKTPTAGNKTIGRKSAGFMSPAETGLNKSMLGKTPNKFDLQASLKKPLKYKPHTGKLKDVYFADRKSIGPMNATFEKKDVKEISRTKSTRDARRTHNAMEKKKKRENMVSKRRGIIG